MHNVRNRAARSRRLWLVALSLGASLAAMVVVASSDPRFLSHAEAQQLRANVYVTQAAIPRGLTEKALIGFARGHNARVLNESSEPELANRKWLANMVVAFNAPPNDLEYHALYYDVTNGTRNYLDDMAIYINDRTQKTYVQRLTLPRPRFAPNKRYELVVTVRRAEVGRARFETRGEEVRRSGTVDFTDEN